MKFSYYYGLGVVRGDAESIYDFDARCQRAWAAKVDAAIMQRTVTSEERERARETKERLWRMRLNTLNDAVERAVQR